MLLQFISLDLKLFAESIFFDTYFHIYNFLEVKDKNKILSISMFNCFILYFRCNMCKEYIYKGKKFNSRKEDVMDEDYLGLRIFRFYIKCPRCVSEIAFKVNEGVSTVKPV